MRWGRDGLNRGSLYSRQGGLVFAVNISSYLDSFSDQAARLRIGDNLASFFDTQSDIYAQTPLTLAAYADSGTDIYARLRLDDNLASFVDTESSTYARQQITQLLKTRTVAGRSSDWGKWQFNRSGYSRRNARTTPQAQSGTYSDVSPRLTLGLSLSGYPGSQTDIHAALLLAFSAYVDAKTDEYARLRIDQGLSSHEDTVSDLVARLRLSGYLSGHLDDSTDQDARLRLDHLLRGYEDTSSDIHAALLLALSVYVDTDSDLSARLLASWEPQAKIKTTTDIFAGLEVSQLLGAHIDSQTDIYAKYLIPHLIKAHIDTAADIYATLKAIDSWTFTFSGTLAPGKTLCIDKSDFTVKNDGVNAMVGFTGEFPAILPGENTVVYTDALGSRTITIIVSKKDRSI